MAIGAVNANLNTSVIFTSEAVKKNIAVYNGVLCFCLALGPLSYILFWFQRRNEATEKDSEDEQKNCEEVRLFEQVLVDIKLGRRPKVHAFVRLANVFAVMLDYPIILLRIKTIIVGEAEGNPFWNGLSILFFFLPGFAWYSHRDLVGPQNRLTWFLSSLFFPGFVTWTRVNLSSQSVLTFFSVQRS